MGYTPKMTISVGRCGTSWSNGSMGPFFRQTRLTQHLSAQSFLVQFKFLGSLAISGTDWLEVPTIYFWPIFQIFQGYFLGNIHTTYGQTYGTNNVPPSVGSWRSPIRFAVPRNKTKDLQEKSWKARIDDLKTTIYHRIGWWENWNRKAQSIWWYCKNPWVSGFDFPKKTNPMNLRPRNSGCDGFGFQSLLKNKVDMQFDSATKVRLQQK